MSAYKKQHYVPRRYLKAWSTDNRRIWMFDKNTERSCFAGIASVAQETYFNDSFRRSSGQITDGEAPDLVERQFQIWEEQFVTMRQVALDVAANKKEGSLEERKIMATCAALQLLRTSKARKALIREVQEVTSNDTPERRRVIDWIKEPLRSKILQDPNFSHEHISLIQTHLLWCTDIIPQIAAELYHYLWVIAKNSTALPFYTSDAPVASLIHNKGKAPFYPTPRIYSEEKGEMPLLKDFFCNNPLEGGLELTFPISPECAVLMFHPLDFENELSDKQGKVLVVGAESVSIRNVVIAHSAVRQVFSSNNDFTIAHNLQINRPSLVT